MDHDRNAGMAAALRLTREGRLTEAVAVLQRTLRARPADPKADVPSSGSQTSGTRTSETQALPPTADGSPPVG